MSMPFSVDFARAPFLVIWETTRSCALACKHCRASAERGRDPLELSTDEGRRLIDETAEMGTPVFILSGGDPLERSDLEDLVRHGTQRGLRMGTIPAATENLTRERLKGLADAGLAQVAFSVDGPTAELHDSFRGTPGAFATTMQGLAWAREVGLPLQINTVLARWNLPYLEDLITLVRSQKIVFWEVFFLIPIGRGSAMQGLDAEEMERVFERMAEINDMHEFVVKLTEGQHYKRFLIQRRSGAAAGAGADGPRHPGAKLGTAWSQGGIGVSPQAVNAGKGFAFVDHHGDICPSGFLPTPAGNVRTDRIADVYRDAPLFRALRDHKLLHGKCGACEYAAICGGSRARSHAMTGDYLASDPRCAYVPGEARAHAV